jgi:hypothetical protein
VTEHPVEAQDDWKAGWAPVIAQIGTDLSDGKVRYGADAVEPGAIRRYLEPLEFDCPLHYSAEVAREYGFADVTAPYTAASTFTAAAVWRPGEAVFTSDARNAQPARVSVKPAFPPGAPPVTGYFATDIETEYLRAVVAGERLGRRGNRLVACTPKETKVGRGAFVTFESEIVDQKGLVVSRMRASLFLYNPHPKAGA